MFVTIYPGNKDPNEIENIFNQFAIPKYRCLQILIKAARLQVRFLSKREGPTLRS
jgi:hypothetical protein